MNEETSDIKAKRLATYKELEAQLKKHIDTLKTQIEELQYDLMDNEFAYNVTRRKIVEMGGQIEGDIEPYAGSIENIYDNMIVSRKWSIHMEWRDKIKLILETIKEGYVDDIVDYLKSVEPKAEHHKLKKTVTFYCYKMSQEEILLHTKHGKKYKYRLK